MSQIPLCALPFTQLHVNPDGSFRECCQTYPQMTVKETTVIEWWFSNKKLATFRDQLVGTTLPENCSGCALQENITNTSYRIEINKQTKLQSAEINFPSRWHICFGNKCNLGCWTCNETYSSTIEKQKQKLGIIDIKESNNDKFNQLWDNNLKDAVLESYKYHDKINLSFLGGEPTYNKKLLDFLNYLIENNLGKRTRLEITTNGTQSLSKIQHLLDQQSWDHISVFISIDAIGAKTDWLRYGSDWEVIDKNVAIIKKIVGYCEIHSAISILNISDIIDVYDYAKLRELKFTPVPVESPNFMNIKNWDGENPVLGRLDDFQKRNLQDYYWLVGSDPVLGNRQKLKNYIESLNPLREKRLKDYDLKLSNSIGLS